MSNRATRKTEDELEHTRERIYAYLGHLEELPGVALTDAFHRGRNLIEKMACQSRGSGSPTTKLTLADCADVLAFMRQSQPVDAEGMYAEQLPSPQCGLMEVLHHVGQQLRVAHLRELNRKK